MSNKTLMLIFTALMTFATLAGAFFAYQSYQLELIKTVAEKSEK
ncbi:hypothetical protein [Peribacillus simplex]|uniref:Uncharacterized protein n=1 Tax=Peribacillus simplex TaxID=1478 RepID=A0AAN2PDD7_9BACI|nr:hypothetical protein [Peribacillus simplex]CEG24550.1 hypothetical protein BN1180_05365 [Peribacillus simplex]